MGRTDAAEYYLDVIGLVDVCVYLRGSRMLPYNNYARS
jgi:hypothetical protein